jgi:hypothetical protein
MVFINKAFLIMGKILDKAKTHKTQKVTIVSE